MRRGVGSDSVIVMMKSVVAKPSRMSTNILPLQRGTVFQASRRYSSRSDSPGLPDNVPEAFQKELPVLELTLLWEKVGRLQGTRYRADSRE